MLPVDDPAHVQAMSHLVRVRIMAFLQERQASPTQLSEWLAASLGSVSYHVRKLHELGLIELVDETRVRGAVEHHYRAKRRVTPTAEEWANPSPVAKQATVSSQLGMLEAHTHAAGVAGGFDGPNAVIARKLARLDAKGCIALGSEARKFLERVDKIEAEAAKRLAKAGDADAVDAGVVLLGFESPSLGS
jgi:DNA-binding transcriptional ArsR family regulator